MRSARLAIVAAIATVAVLTGCSTFLELLEGPSTAAGQSLSNLLRNPGFESMKVFSRGVAADWMVSEGYATITTSLSKDAFRGDVAQRIDVLAIEPGREDPWIGITPSRSRLRLKGNTQYEISAWVKGRGTVALSVMLNDDESASPRSEGGPERFLAVPPDVVRHPELGAERPRARPFRRWRPRGWGLAADRRRQPFRERVETGQSLAPGHLVDRRAQSGRHLQPARRSSLRRWPW